MPKIFVSYRREESQQSAARLGAILSKGAAKGDIVFSAGGGSTGLDALDQIGASIEKCDVLLALIGVGWLNAQNPRSHRRQLDDPKDEVRAEIASALRLGKPVKIVLLDGASLPEDKDLPADLKLLPKSDCFPVREGQFDADVAALIDQAGLRPVSADRPKPIAIAALPAKFEVRRSVLLASHVIALLLGVGVGAWIFGLDVGRQPDLVKPSNPRPASTIASTVAGSPASPSEKPASVVSPPLPAAAGSIAAVGAVASPDEDAWKAAAKAATREAFEAYQRGFPTGAHIAEARTRIAVLPPPPPKVAGALPTGAKIRPGQSFRDCATCPEMVALAEGSFLMGSPETDPGRANDEGPQRQITLKSFAVGKYEVTQGEWKDCALAGACPALTNSGEDGRKPVSNISWREAKSFVAWLSSTTGQTYRLLSEAEWEYAARGGTATPFPWGDAASHDRANYGADRCCEGIASGKDRWVGASPVGSFPADVFGLYDMLGNVSEWVEDCYDGSYSQGQPTNGTAFSPAGCQSRVTRGGSWVSAPILLRTTARDWLAPATRNPGLGFRLARSF